MVELGASLDFAEIVNGAKSSDNVSPDTLELDHGFGSVLVVRKAGGFITTLELVNSSSTQSDVSAAILYCESDLTVPKLTASHAMTPFGPYEGPGGQHGFPRWVNYTSVEDGEGQLSLISNTPAQGPRLAREFILGSSRLITLTTLAHGTEDMQTSMGEHYYFRNTHDPAEIEMNGQMIPGIEKIKQGEAQFVEFDGSAMSLAFPDGRTLRLSADYGTPEEAQPDQLGMFVWTRPEKTHDYICFEPVAGVRPGDVLENDRLKIPARVPVQLETTIELV